MKKIIIGLVLLSLFASWPFFKSGFFESHDGDWMIIRFSAFHQTLTSGQFPVRFVDRLNNNYGYPVLNFLYPLPFYLAEVPKLFGFGFVDSIKVIFVASNIVSIVAMFWALSRRFSTKASFAGAALYLFLPYRFVDLYVRASLGESLAFAIVPIVAGLILQIPKNPSIYLPPLSISVFLLVLSHNVIAAFFIPFLFVFSMIVSRNAAKQILTAFTLGILASSFFWFPALYDLQFVRLSQIEVSNITDHLVSPLKLLDLSWGYGPNPSGSSGLSTQIGVAAILAIAASAYFAIKEKNKDSLITFLLISVLSVVFLMTNFSQPVWDRVPYIDVIQFPWRLLSLVVFASAFLAAFAIEKLPGKTLASIVFVVSAVALTITYTKPAAFVQQPEGFYATNEDTTTVRDEYLPLWVKEKMPQRANQKIEIGTSAVVENIKITPANYQAKISVSEETKITVNSIYFPGWQALANGKNVAIDYQNKYGLITFNLPEGIHEVIIKYGKSDEHKIVEIISALSLLAIIIYSLNLWRRQNS